jgi:hypothetical protein
VLETVRFVIFILLFNLGDVTAPLLIESVKTELTVGYIEEDGKGLLYVISTTLNPAGGGVVS